MDYEKAFDKVHHKILSKLKLFGFDSELLLLFETYPNGRTQVVNVNGYFSEHLSVPSGVPQGSVLGPFLFLIIINDLPSIFLDAMIWLFADDLKLLFSSLNFHNDLTRLYNWNLSNGMIANLGKTNCLNFRGLTSVTMNDCLLKKVEYTKDLGIIVSHSLKWTASVQMRVTKAQRSFYSLKQKIPWQTPSEKEFNLYISQLLSVLLNGIPSWSPDITRLKIMENFQKQCFKWIFGTKTSYQQLLKNHSILPICHLIELRTFIFLSQLMNNKYLYDYRKFLVVNDSTNQRRICSFNFFKTNTLSSNLNSFFTRSAIMANYLFRHKTRGRTFTYLD